MPPDTFTHLLTQPPTEFDLDRYMDSIQARDDPLADYTPDWRSRNSSLLFRSSPAGPETRIHVATFDAPESAEYNAENCDVAASLFMSQAGVTVRYWCEGVP